MVIDRNDVEIASTVIRTRAHDEATCVSETLHRKKCYRTYQL